MTRSNKSSLPYGDLLAMLSTATPFELLPASAGALLISANLGARNEWRRRRIRRSVVGSRRTKCFDGSKLIAEGFALPINTRGFHQ